MPYFAAAAAERDCEEEGEKKEEEERGEVEQGVKKKNWPREREVHQHSDTADMTSLSKGRRHFGV
jgi:hypothetical protein